MTTVAQRARKRFQREHRTRGAAATVNACCKRRLHQRGHALKGEEVQCGHCHIRWVSEGQDASGGTRWTLSVKPGNARQNFGEGDEGKAPAKEIEARSGRDAEASQDEKHEGENEQDQS